MFLNTKLGYVCYVKWWQGGISDLIVACSEKDKEEYVKQMIASGEKQGLMKDYGYPPYVNMVDNDEIPIYEIVTIPIDNLISAK